MAFLTALDAPGASLPTRLAALSDRIDWSLVTSVAFILATVLLQAALMAAERPTLDTGACERRASVFFPPVH